jgi:AraC family transcriptional regulator
MATFIAPGGMASDRRPDGIATMTHRRRIEPEYVVCGDEASRFYAAKWSLPAHRIRTDCRMDNILVSRRRGAAPLTKTAGGKSQRSYAVPGAFTFIPSGEYAQYSVAGDSVFLELYVAPSLLREFAEQHDLSTNTSIRPVLAQSDLWLAGYFQMLESEIELYRSPLRALDLLLLGQAQQLLLAHLLRCYSGLQPHKIERLDAPHAGALRAPLLKRVYEFIDANLSSDIRLADLAQLAHLSERHFIRAFRAATGCTPYRYVIDKRLRVCAELLRTQSDLSVADVAAMMRFRSRPHFSAQFSERFGVTPSVYRSQTNE